MKFRDLFRGDTGPQGIQGPPGQVRYEQSASEVRAIEAWQRRAEHYRSRMEYFRGRVAKAIWWFRKHREENVRLQNERDSATRQVETLRLKVKQLECSQAAVIQINALSALFGQRPASEVYAAQEELELLRVIRKSQGEGITKLRKERDDARSDKLEFQQSLIKACQERDAWRQEALNLEVRLHACDCIPGVTYCSKCTSTRIVYSNPIEAMKSNPRLAMMLDETRRAYNRNVDNQKAYEAPNCPSS